MRLFRGVIAWHSALAASRQSALCVVFDLHATVTTKTPFLARIWLSELHHAFPRYPTEREKGGHVPSPRSYTTKAPLACARRLNCAFKKKMTSFSSFWVYRAP